MSSDGSLADMAAVAEGVSSGESRPATSTIGTSTPTMGTSASQSRASPETVPQSTKKESAGIVDLTEESEAEDKGRMVGAGEMTSSLGGDGHTEKAK